MVFRLNAGKEMIGWECRNNGALYNITLSAASYQEVQDAQAVVGNTLTLPKSFCNLGFQSLYLAFAFSLAVDIGLQICESSLCPADLAGVESQENPFIPLLDDGFFPSLLLILRWGLQISTS